MAPDRHSIHHSEQGITDMRLYTRTGATSVTDPADEAIYEVDENGSLEVPDELGEHLHGMHVKGKPAFENDEERKKRLGLEDLDRRRDPAVLYDLLSDAFGGQQSEPVDVPALIEAALAQRDEEHKAATQKAVDEALAAQLAELTKPDGDSAGKHEGDADVKATKAAPAGK